MTAQDLGIFFRHTLGDHGDHLDVRIVQGFHPALHGPICANVDEAGVDLWVVLRGFCDGLIDGSSQQATTVGNLVRLAGVRRIDEGQDVQRAFDQVAKLGHPTRSVHACDAALDDHIGIFICQDTHRDLPFSKAVMGDV